MNLLLKDLAPVLAFDTIYHSQLSSIYFFFFSIVKIRDQAEVNMGKLIVHFVRREYSYSTLLILPD